MEVLLQHNLNPQLPSHKAMIDVGGLWQADLHADPADIVARARALNVRALILQTRDIRLIRRLPQLEFLQLIDMADPEPLYSLDRLRGLLTSGWDGRIDFQRLPHLESFCVVECPLDEGGLDSLYAGHASMRDLTIQRYRHADLRPLQNLRLEKLNIGYTRKLTTLDGIEALAPTLRRLGLYACSNLTSLDQLQSLTNLEALELGTLRHIKTLDIVARLPWLRSLHVFELAGVESLWPLANHPSLEFLLFGRIRDLDLNPLLTLPRLKLTHTGKWRWNLEPEALPQLESFDDDDSVIWEWRSLEV